MKIEKIRSERTESAIVKACCDYLAAKRYFWWRQNNGGVYNVKKASFMKNPNTRKGVPDIFALGRTKGSFIAIECKTSVGRQSPDQKNFEVSWGLTGGVYILARSVDDLIKAGL